MNHTGNQLTWVNDAAADISYAPSADYKDKKTTSGTIEYTYNKNGAMSKDDNKGITEIQYNSLNLPRQMVINSASAKAKNYYTYSASGVKLKTEQRYDPALLNSPIGTTTPATDGLTDYKNTDYAGNIIYETMKSGSTTTNKTRILVDGGYIEYNAYYFYLNDHLGNNRVVTNASGTVTQKNHYYPFGTTFAESTSADAQPYKYNGKELDKMHGLNLYDYSARYYESAIGWFTTIDPHAENYYSWSPYHYAANNPIRITDPTGMDWYLDSDSTYQFHPALNAENKDAFLAFLSLREGKTNISYVGATHQTVNADYRSDGSIVFSDESAAYSRMVSQFKKTGNEEFSVIADNEILVLPSHGNKSGEAGIEKYGYSIENGQLYDPLSQRKQSFLATAHIHPTGAAMGKDDLKVAINSQGKPAYALMLGTSTYEKNSIIGMQSFSGERYRYIYVTKENPSLTVPAIIKGASSLRVFTKQRRN